MLSKALVNLAAAGLAAAHYTLVYPEWRGDSLDSESNYTQWERPCAGVPYGAGNRTDWPISGGSLSLSLGHAFNYAFVNLGLEENGTVASFNISLTPQPLNTTGHGTLCLRTLPINVDFDIAEGANASIQVVKVGSSGNAMYNCADIRLTSAAEPLSEEECTSEDAYYYVLEDQEGFNATDGHGHGDHSDHGSDSNSTDSGDSNGDGGSAASFNAASLSSVVALGVAVTFAMNL